MGNLSSDFVAFLINFHRSSLHHNPIIYNILLLLLLLKTVGNNIDICMCSTSCGGVIPDLWSSAGNASCFFYPFFLYSCCICMYIYYTLHFSTHSYISVVFVCILFIIMLCIFLFFRLLLLVGLYIIIIIITYLLSCLLSTLSEEDNNSKSLAWVVHYSENLLQTIIVINNNNNINI